MNQNSMQANLTPNPIPPLSVPSHVALTELEKTLIQRVHQGCGEVLVEKEFGGGYSGTRVLLILPVKPNGTSEVRLVTKLGPTEALRREKANFDEYVRHALPFTGTQVGEYYAQGDWAALNYVFAGGDELGETVSLEEYYHTHPARDVIETLRGLFEDALGPRWYSQSGPLNRSLRDEYGRHLPPHKDLEEIVITIFPVLATAGDKVKIPGVDGTYPHPLSVYRNVENKTLEGRQSVVHGDLHLGNVLVDESGKGWLIDFAKVTERHNLFDFIKLETYIRLVALPAEQGAFAWNDYVQFEDALSRNSAPPVSPALSKAYAVIQAIRDLARNYMRNRRHFMEEYLTGLFLYILAMLKYYPSNGPAPTQLMFLTACVLGRYLVEGGERGLPTAPITGIELPDVSGRTTQRNDTRPHCTTARSPQRTLLVGTVSPEIRKRLIQVLTLIPAAATFDGRTALVSSLPPNVVAGLNRSNNAMVDLTNIITQLSALGRLSSGEWPLLVIIENALLQAAGADLGQELEAVRETLTKFYER